MDPSGSEELLPSKENEVSAVPVLGSTVKEASGVREVTVIVLVAVSVFPYSSVTVNSTV